MPATPDVKLISAAEWKSCLSTPKDNCSGNCILSNAAEMIPESEYCAPVNTPTGVNDYPQVVDCINSDQAKCSGQCQWRKGKVVASNNDFVANSDIFASNFCHPPTTNNWD